MSFSQVCWYPDRVGHIQVAVLVLCFVNREAFSLQFYFGSVLCFRRDLEFYFSAEGIYCDLATQNSCIQIQLNICVQVISKTLELWMIVDKECNVKIAVRSSINALASMPGDFNCLTVLNTGRDCDSYLFPVNFQGALMGSESIDEIKIKLCVIIFPLNFTRLLLPPVLNSPNNDSKNSENSLSS